MFDILCDGLPARLILTIEYKYFSVSLFCSSFLAYMTDVYIPSHLYLRFHRGMSLRKGSLGKRICFILLALSWGWHWLLPRCSCICFALGVLGVFCLCLLYIPIFLDVYFFDWEIQHSSTCFLGLRSSFRFHFP